MGGSNFAQMEGMETMETEVQSLGKLKAKELLKEAYSHLEKGDDLALSYHQFNLLLNETIHQTGEIDVLLFYLGCVNMKMGHHAMAIFLFKLAIEQRPDFIAAINNLGYVFKKEGLHNQSKDCFRQVVKLIEEGNQEVPDKDKAEYYTNMGSSMIANGDPKKALELFEKAESLDPGKDILKWNRGLAYLELGDYERGFKDYANGERGELATRRTYYKDMPLPDWDGTKGQHIVVYGEQGIGDELMFASMLPDLVRDCEFVLDCHPRLIEIFRESFPNIAIYGTRKTEIVRMGWLKHHKKFDAKIPIGNLAIHYRKKKEDFPRVPYIKANDQLIEVYAEKLKALGDRPKIGFSYRGGIKTTNGTARYIPLEQWLDIFKLDADFISLQYNKDAIDEINQFQDKHGICLNHDEVTLADYDKTAGLVHNLDLIISVPQSVVHLAGGMGKIVWQLSPYRAMWQVGPYGEDMPWYQSVHNFWQSSNEKWEPVLNRVKDELCSLLATNTES